MDAFTLRIDPKGWVMGECGVGERACQGELQVPSRSKWGVDVQ